MNYTQDIKDRGKSLEGILKTIVRGPMKKTFS